MSGIEPGSIEHRKKVAEKYGFVEQEVIDLPKKEFHTLCVGLNVGEKYGARKILDYMKEEHDKEVKEAADDKED